jgi:hypothetical protein
MGIMLCTPELNRSKKMECRDRKLLGAQLFYFAPALLATICRAKPWLVRARRL